MAALELEDGELLDSDSDNETSSKIQTASTISQNYRKPVNPSSYRDRSDPKIASSSDDSDDEKFTWKKKRYDVASKDQQSSMKYSFSNCIDKNYTGQTTTPQFSFGQDVTDFNTAGKPKKNKNIWGSVLQSQTLSQGFRGFDMEQKRDGYGDRQVESYSYKNALKDTRPWPEEANVESVMTSKKTDEMFDTVPDLEKLEENFNGVYKKAEKRKCSVKKRLGPKPNDKKCKKDFDITANDDEKKVTESIANILEESKVYLIEKVVQVLGKKKAIEVAHITKNVEEHGGMMTNDGGRRRTPGGVFFQLLKTDPEITKQNMKDIFNDEKKEKTKTKKILRAKRFKKKLKKRMEAEMDSTENVVMETVSGNQKEDQLISVVSDDTSSNSKDSYSQSNSSELSNDPTDMDMSDLLKRHKEYQSEQQTMGNSSVEKTDKDSTQDAFPPSTKKNEKRADAVIYLDEDIDMTFDL